MNPKGLLGIIPLLVFYNCITGNKQPKAIPPFGLVTEAFIPLGTYLLFVGIFISARHISREAEVRKEFYNSASSQLTVLKTIGVSEMEKEIESQVEFVKKRAKYLETTEEPELEDTEFGFE
jgi:hypothetical protein